jgi:hypothetical protein
MNTEQIVDTWVKRSIDYYGKSDAELKKHCITASLVVGRYQFGGTQAIASGIKRSLSTVENHAHAHWMYKELRKPRKVRSCVRTLWRTLPASHWWIAYEKIHKQGYSALPYLQNADAHGWSGRDMVMEFERDRMAGNAPIIVKRAKATLAGLARELIEKHGASLKEGEKIVLLSVVETFGEVAQ